MIIFLALLYKGLRGLKFWALNLGLPHEEKPKINNISNDIENKQRKGYRHPHISTQGW